MRRTIHAQGDLDGACFLYAIANAFTALTRRPPDLKAWGARVRDLPHATVFMDGATGTTGVYETTPALLVSAAEQLLADGPGPDLVVELAPGAASIASVADLISARSVAVLRYRGSARHAKKVDHWVCGVAAATAPGQLHVACSIRWSDVYRLTDDEYREDAVAFGRRSNDLLVEPDSAVVQGFVLRVSSGAP